MSKYEALWRFVGNDGRAAFKMSYDEIAAVAGVAIDHSFLTYKKELVEFGYRVGKISLKDKTVAFERIEG